MTDTVFSGATRADSYAETDAGDDLAGLVEVEDQTTLTAPARRRNPEPHAGGEVPATTAGTVEATDADVAGLFEQDLSAVAARPRPVTAATGVRGILARLGLHVAPGPAERAQLELAAALAADEERIRQATWTRAVGVLVANKKGGAGKTPTALVLGGILAAVRGGSVAVVEVSDDPGALTFRAEGNPARGIGELVRDARGITSAGQLAGYTAPQTSHAAVIGTVGHRARLDEDAVAAAAEVIDRYYSIRVMDSGNQPSSSAFAGAVEAADVLVVPLLNAGDAVLEAQAMIEDVRARGGRYARMADNAVIVRLTDGRPEHEQVVARIDRIIDRLGAGAVFRVPYDEHIAERGQITLDRLAPTTRAAFTAAAAGVVKALQATVN